MKVLNFSQDSGCTELRPLPSRYEKQYLLLEQYSQKHAIYKLKTLKFTLLCIKDIKQNFLVLHFCLDSGNLVLRPHLSRKYYKDKYLLWEQYKLMTS